MTVQNTVLKNMSFFYLKSMKSTHEGVLLLVKLQASHKLQDWHSSMGNSYIFKIVQMVPNYPKDHICSLNNIPILLLKVM